jgi:hypothetical protein
MPDFSEAFFGIPVERPLVSDLKKEALNLKEKKLLSGKEDVKEGLFAWQKRWKKRVGITRSHM